MNKYFAPPQSVIDLVEEVMLRYHEGLEDARIGVLFREEAPVSGEKTTLAATKKVTDEMKAAGLEYDFIIWFAADWWNRLSLAQQTALVDHELCHCDFDANQGKAKILPHDVEEFNQVIARHGFWWPGANETHKALQSSTMPLFGRMGRVEVVTAAGPIADLIRGEA